MARKRRRKVSPRPASVPPPAPPAAGAAAGPGRPAGPRWDPSLDVRLLGAYLAAVLSLAPLGAAGFLGAAAVGWIGAGTAALCVLGAVGWRRRWGWRRPGIPPARRRWALGMLGAGTALLVALLRLAPPATGARAALSLAAAGALGFLWLILSGRAHLREGDFRRACRRLVPEAGRAWAALPRWKRALRRGFHGYMAASWVAGLAYFYAYGAAVEGGAREPTGDRTERLATDGRTAYVTPREARALGWWGAGVSLNLPLLVLAGLFLQAGLRVPVLGPPRGQAR